jgi:hypothetical protein
MNWQAPDATPERVSTIGIRGAESRLFNLEYRLARAKAESQTNDFSKLIDALQKSR